ncbi:hypothetical protein GNI_202810 [Gregarina niphandrodes]|uniref:Uncharacterized protein n=1 Tax=Gregarina niphandrodes TaxID=110365 RepID=A0A023AW56_GRENI|nr:hypothetical protein GNI_202810 [Gregarina niphandrodes]EZG42966.1 hypothetical protein GNI_202810 [Gregarina niphandrodes]|eukprot:XP_011133761.1 hypothetical protein GNI_202810 [Gregarina niphandrodes]
MPSESKFSVRGSTSSKTKKVASDRDEELKALLKASNELQEKIASILDARAADDKLPKDEVKEANPDSSDSSSSSDEDNSSESGMSSGAYSRKSSTSSLQSNRHRLALLREAKQPRTYIDHHMTRRLIKELNIKESFNPRHEKAYDDQLDLLERLTRAKGFEVNLLPQVITSVADDNVLYRINKYELHHIHEWSKFRDRLAKKLYPYSNEIDIVAQSLSEPEDREDAEDLVMWFEKTIALSNLY